MKSLTKKILTFVFSAIVTVAVAVGVAFFATDGFGSNVPNLSPVQVEQTTNASQGPEVNDSEVSNEPGESSSDPEVSNEPGESSSDPEVSNEPGESTSDPESPTEPGEGNELPEAPDGSDTEDKDPDNNEYGDNGYFYAKFYYYLPSTNSIAMITMTQVFTVNYNVEQYVYCNMPSSIPVEVKTGIVLYGYSYSESSTSISFISTYGRVGTNVGRGSGNATVEYYAVYHGDGTTLFNQSRESTGTDVSYAVNRTSYGTAPSTTNFFTSRYRFYYYATSTFFSCSQCQSWTSNGTPSGYNTCYVINLSSASIPSSVGGASLAGFSASSNSYTVSYKVEAINPVGSYCVKIDDGTPGYYLYAVYYGTYGDYTTTGTAKYENINRTYYYWGSSGTTSASGNYTMYKWNEYTSGYWNYNFKYHTSGITSTTKKSLKCNSGSNPPSPTSANGCTFSGWTSSSTGTSAITDAEYSSYTSLYAVYYGKYSRTVTDDEIIWFYYSSGSIGTWNSSKISCAKTTTYSTSTSAYFNYSFTSSTATITTSTSYDYVTAPTLPNITISGQTAKALGFSDQSSSATYNITNGARFRPTRTSYYAKYLITHDSAQNLVSNANKTVNFDWGSGNGGVSSKSISISSYECISKYQSWYNYYGSLISDVDKEITYSFYSDGTSLPTQSDSKYLFARLSGWRLGSTSGTLYSTGSTYGTVSSEGNSSSSTTPYTDTVTFYAEWSSSSPTSSSATTTVSVTNTSFTYDGYSHKPSVSVMFNGSTLSSSYYSLSYYYSSGSSVSSPTSAGTYKVRVSGTSSYPAYTYYEYSFTISKDTIYKVNLTINGSSATYTNGDTKTVTYSGSSMYPTVNRVYGYEYGPFTSTTLGYSVSPSSSNSNFVNVGTVTFTITGTNNFTGTIRISIEIQRASISNYTFTLYPDSYVYNGQYKTPSVSHATLIQDEDYTVSYSNNLNAGNASVIITGINSYCDTKTIGFTINKAALYSVVASIKEGTTTRTATSTSSSTGTLTITYQAKEMLPSYSVTASGSVSVPSSYYSVTYTRTGASNPATYRDAGTTTITISAKKNGSLDNFSGSLTVKYVINPKTISDLDVDITLSSYYYYFNRKEKTPTVTVEYNDETLTKIESMSQNTSYDYRYTYQNNTNAGTAYVNIYANNVNYTGSTSVSFTIYKATLSTAYYYKQSTGTSSTYSVTNGCSLSEVYSRTADAFTLYRVATTSSSNINAYISSEINVVYKRGSTETEDLQNHGTITATITSASSNFDGSIAFTLIINQRSLSTYYSNSFSLSPTSFVYDGSYKTPTVTCSHSDKLVYGTDYTYEYYNNRNASSNARVVITAVSDSNFCDSVTKYFTIEPATLTSVDVKIDSTTYTFKGSSLSKTLTYKRAAYAISVTGVYDESGAKFTDSNTFYTVTYTRGNVETKDFKSHGTITIKVNTVSNASGVRNYVGSMTITITINRLSISGYKDYFKLEYSRTFYNYGKELRPSVTVSDPINDITSSEYSVSYSNNIYSTKGYTQAVVTITGLDNYNDSFNLYFDIDPIKLDTSGTQFEGGDSGVKYNSSSGLFEITYDKGYHKIVIVNYYCSQSELDNDLRHSIFGLTVSYQVTYTKVGTASSSQTNEDSCRNAGDYVFVATFTPIDSRNFYTEPTTKTATMRILPKSLTAADLGVENFIITPNTFVYDSFAKTPEVSSKDTDILLGQGFEIDGYADNINATDNAKIYIHGINNYKDSLTLTFTITKVALKDVYITVSGYSPAWNSIEGLIYTRYAFAPSFVVYNANGRRNFDIVPSTEYTISSSRNDGSGRPHNDYTNVGTVTYTFTAKPNSVNFKGSTTATMQIVPRPLTQESVTIVVTSTHLYNGEPQDPTFVLNWKGTDLVPYSDGLVFYDYTYTVSNNIEAGDNTGIIDITLHGNYSGTLVGNFSIYRRMISLSGVTFSNEVVNYDRQAHFIYIKGVPESMDAPFKTDVSVEYDIFKLVDGSRQPVATSAHSLSDCTLVKDVGEYVFVAHISLSNKNLYLDIDNYEASLTINGIMLNLELFSLEQTSYKYDGQIHKPKVNCTADYLVPDVDYKVYYSRSAGSKENIDPVDVATYYVIIEGFGNYFGNTVFSYRINKAQLSKVELRVRGTTYGSDPSFVFDGSPFEPEFAVFDENNLPVGSSYLKISELDEAGNNSSYTNVGSTTITITALTTSNWSGTLNASLTITSLTVNEDESGEEGFVLQVISSHVYNQKAQTPTLLVKYHNIELKLGSDYTISDLNNNINAGTAQVTITFMNNYSGTATTTFTIEQKALSGVVIIIGGNHYTNTVSLEYTGEKIEPTFSVYAGDILVESMYYTYTSPNIVGTGTYPVVFTAYTNSNYKGSVTATIEVTGKKVDEEVEKGTFQFVLDQSVFVYNGSDQKPIPYCTGEEAESVTYDYYYAIKQGEGYVEIRNSVDAGTYYVVVTGTGNYSGEFVLEYSINPVDISYFRMAVNPSNPNSVREYLGYNVNASREYSSESFNLYFMAYDSNTFKIDSKYYKVEYFRDGEIMQEGALDLSSVGEISIVITALTDTEFVQNYTGSVTATFTITKVNANSGGNRLEFSMQGESFVYNQKPQKPEVSVKFNGSELDGSDYELSYQAVSGGDSSSKNVGIYRVVVTLTGNYEGTWQREYRITPARIDSLTLSIDGAGNNNSSNVSVVFTGSVIVPVFTLYAGELQVESEVFEVQHDELKDVGTYTLIASLTDAEGASNYILSNITAKLTVTQRAVTQNELEFEPINNTFVYDGTEKFATFKVLLNGEELEHSYEYRNNINANDNATAVIILSGNYSGRFEQPFTINPASLGELEIHIGDQVSVDGDITGYWTGESLQVTFRVYDENRNIVNSGYYTITVTNDDEDFAYQNGLDVGVYTVTANSRASSGHMNYSGTLTGNITVIRDEGNLPSVDDDSELVYEYQNEWTYDDGKPITPSIRVLKQGEDIGRDNYDIKYEDNVNAGTGTIIVVGKNAYKGTKRLQFTIKRKAISLSGIGFTTDSFEFDGSLRTLQVTNLPTSAGLPYSQIYTYTATVTGKEGLSFSDVGEYEFVFEFNIVNKNYHFGSGSEIVESQSFTHNLTITALKVEESSGAVSFRLAYTTIVYNGKSNVPEILAYTSGKYSGVELTYTSFVAQLNGGEYQKLSGEAVDVGEYYIVITLYGNFEGTVRLKYEITKATIDFSGVKFASERRQYSAQNQELEYSGLPEKIGDMDITDIYLHTLQVRFGGQDWSLDNVIGVGTYTFTLSFSLNNENEKAKNFTLSKTSIEATLEIYKLELKPGDESRFEISVDIETDTYVYDGEEHTPAVTVYELVYSYDENDDRVVTKNLLKIDVDYTLNYSDNTNAGTATITITLIKNYSGTIERHFEIKKAIIDTSSVVFESLRQEYTGKAQTITPSNIPTQSENGLSVVNILKYSITVSHNGAEWSEDCIEIGTYIFTLTFTLDSGNELSNNFSISQQSKTATLEIYSKRVDVGDSYIEVTLEDDSFVYTGSQITPSVTVYEVVEGKRTQLDESQYNLEYSNNTNAGEASVLVTLLGNYSGTITKTFTIQKATLRSVTITINGESAENSFSTTYSGEALFPSFVVKDASGKIVPADNYNISYDEGGMPTFVDAKVYRIYFAAKPNAEKHTNYRTESDAPLKATITITALKVDEPEIVDEISVTVTSTHVYNGNVQTPEIVVMYNSTVLVEEQDFDVNYDDGRIDAGTYKIYITFKGNYSGSYTSQFTIEKAILDLSEVQFNNATFVYDGEPKSIAPSNVPSAALCSVETHSFVGEHEQSECVDVGIYSFVATFTIVDHNYKFRDGDTQTMTATLTIRPAGLDVGGQDSKFAYELSKDSYIYDGTQKEPGVTVKFNSEPLVKEQDYRLEYSNNTDAGRASVKIIGLNNFAGGGTEVVLYFTIEQAEICRVDTYFNGETYDLSQPFTFFGGDLKSGLSFKVYANADEGTQEVPASYLVRTDSADTFTDVGSYTVTFTTGDTALNYSGMGQVTIRIVAVESGNTPEGKNFRLEVSGGPFVYNKEVQRPTIVVSYGAGADWITLIDEQDYQIEYLSDCIKAGTHEFQVKLQGNYSGTLSGEFEIQKAVIDLSGLAIEGERSVEFDGEPHSLSITGLPEGLDDTYSYSVEVSGHKGLEFVDAGEYRYVYTFSVKDPENYKFNNGESSSSIEATLTITKLDIEKGIESQEVKFTLDSYSYVYDGSAHTPNVHGTFGTQELLEGQDFDVKITGTDSRHIDAGIYTVTITGKGNYDKTVELSYTIKKADITGLKIVLDGIISTENSLMVAYTGTVIDFSVKVFAGSVDVSEFCDLTYMREGADVTAQMGESSTYAIGEIQITASSKESSNYSGTAEGVLIIVQKAISGGAYTFSLEQDRFTYTGQPFTPKVKVECNDESEAARVLDSVDITYIDNINAGTATVEIVGRGMYTGGVYLYFTIDRAKIERAQVRYQEQISTTNSLDIVYLGEDIRKDVGALVYARGADNVLTEIDSANYEIIFADDMTNVGLKTLTVRAAFNSEAGAQNYEGEINVFIRIMERSIGGYEFKLKDTEFYYDGNAKSPEVICALPASNYAVEYIGNVDAGKAQARIRGINNYTGEIILDFEILSVQLSKLTVMVNGVYSTGSILTTEYTGSIIEPTLIVRDSRGNLVDLDELIIVCDDEILSVKSYNIVLSSKANTKGGTNYTGTLYGGVIVSQGLLKSYEFELQQTEFVYSGEAHTPKVNYTGRLKDFVESRDYEVVYQNNTDAGTAQAIVLGIGNYTGEVVLNFNISQLLVNVVGGVQFNDKIVTFNGSAQRIDLELPEELPITISATFQAWRISYDSLGNEIAGDLVDYTNCVNVGDYRFMVTLASDDPNYILDVTEYEAVLKIVRAKINESMFTLDFEGDDLVYNGLAHCPRVVPERDFITFTAEYGNNIDAGTAYIILTGTGNYDEDSVRLTFTIAQAEIDLTAALWDQDSFVYDGTEKQVSVINLPQYVLDAIIYGGEYTGIDAGVYSATASIAASNNYLVIGEIKTLIWEIEKAEVDTSEIVVAEDTVITYDGRPHVVDVSNYDSVKITIRYEFKNELDQSVSYCDRAGIYTVRVLFVPTENYKLASGAAAFVDTTLTIVSRNFENGLGPFIIEEIPNQEYTGEAIIPVVIVRNSDTFEILTEGVDYELQFINNISIGTAIVIVIGMGNYSGEISTTFRIVGRTASNQNSTSGTEVNAKEIGIMVAIFVALIVAFIVTIVIIVYSFTKKSKKKDDDFLQ